MQIKIKRIHAHETIPLRHAILRPHQNQESCIYPGDDLLENIHLGAFFDQKLIGILSLYQQKLPDDPCKNSWRLRGMAVLPTFQNKGIGSLLVKESMKILKKQTSNFIIWCNARENAIIFYKRLNFDIISDQFEIKNIGLHKRMRIKL